MKPCSDEKAGDWKLACDGEFGETLAFAILCDILKLEEGENHLSGTNRNLPSVTLHFPLSSLAAVLGRADQA